MYCTVAQSQGYLTDTSASQQAESSSRACGVSHEALELGLAVCDFPQRWHWCGAHAASLRLKEGQNITMFVLGIGAGPAPVWSHKGSALCAPMCYRHVDSRLVAQPAHVLGSKQVHAVVVSHHGRGQVH